MKIKTTGMIALSLFSLNACIKDVPVSGGDEQNQNTTPANALQGKLLDSYVSNIVYETETLNGKTKADGTYYYLEGETVTFKIGDITLPSSSARGLTTPFTISASTDLSDIRVINITRLLQTLDADADPDNGIHISDEVHTAADGMSVNFAATDFTTEVQALLDNLGIAALIPEIDAMAHLTTSVSHVMDLEKFLNQTSFFVSPFLDGSGDFFYLEYILKDDGYLYAIDETGAETQDRSAGFSLANEAIISKVSIEDPNDSMNYILVDLYIVVVNYDVGKDMYTYCQATEGLAVSRLEAAIGGASLNLSFTTIDNVDQAVKACRALYAADQTPTLYNYYTFTEQTAIDFPATKMVMPSEDPSAITP
ncbi:MAG: hypothetical protein HRU20_00660 [Pseudomonadales bacterium]|nr:hypothetical protein [Pseudomonadales bacterium]